MNETFLSQAPQGRTAAGPVRRAGGGGTLILHTGGTIGMGRTPRGFAPLGDFPAVLADRLGPLAPALPAFRIEAFATPIDSSEATPADWIALAACLRSRWLEFDGFVILHGTDTLAFTAAALSFMLRDLDKPVILTGAQVPMGEEGSDGVGNVVAALSFAASGAVREVGIAFAGLLLRGNRATKVSTRRHDGFASPNFPPLGRFRPDQGAVIDRERLLPAAASGPLFEIPARSAGGVLSLRVVPGLMTGALEACLALAPKAVILECYGAGNVPALGGATARFLAAARARGIVVVALSQVGHGGTAPGAYAAGSVLVENGAVDGGDMTFEAAYAKLVHLIACGCDPDGIRSRMAEPLAGERIPECRGSTDSRR